MDVEGIDVAFLGPNDLTQSMGIIGQKEHPKFIQAVAKVIATAREKNKFSGIHLSSATGLKAYIEKGTTCNLWSSDVTMLMSAAREGIGTLTNAQLCAFVFMMNTKAIAERVSINKLINCNPPPQLSSIFRTVSRLFSLSIKRC